MPKLRKSPIQAQMEMVTANVLSRGAYFGCRNDEDYANRLGIGKTTFRDRRIKPRTWRLEELVRAADVFKCSLEWLVSDHTRQE